ncbi:hypothetical protein K7X08_036549 [Anisodus acutangulus]|uniref:Uncharacterized protein n=1 Tax=Anisodus acutangulus TaxID=402998 RepID=A0A9Q1L6J7_9SOLA|nr:hypothetical protein K7X08_036549 [Anisodus acutangulus]
MPPYLVYHLASQTGPTSSAQRVFPPSQPVGPYCPSPVAAEQAGPLPGSPLGSGLAGAVPSQRARTHCRAVRHLLRPSNSNSGPTISHSQHGIFKPNTKYGLHTHVTKSPLPRNPVSTLHDPD